jgi:hypothetical protein
MSPIQGQLFEKQQQLGLFSPGVKAITDCPRIPGRLCAEARDRPGGCPGAKACEEWKAPPPEVAPAAAPPPEQVASAPPPALVSPAPAASEAPAPVASPTSPEEKPLPRPPLSIGNIEGALPPCICCGGVATVVYAAGIPPLELAGPHCRPCADQIINRWQP